MKYHGKTAGILVLLVLLVSVTVAAGEKSVPVGNPEAVSGKGPSKGIRHLFINKPAIAERAQARLQSRPKQPHPLAGRGFLLEKVQGGSAKGELDLAKLRQRQLDQVEGRSAASYPAPKTAGNKSSPPAQKTAPQSTAAGSGFGSVLGAGVVTALLFLGLRWRRGRSDSRQKKKKAAGLC